MKSAVTEASRLLPDGLSEGRPLLWINTRCRPDAGRHAVLDLDPEVASQRFQRFTQLQAHLFPELQAAGGVIESALQPIEGWQAHCGDTRGRWFLKRDDALPVAGSIKARGGFHEILAWAESLALEHGLIQPQDDRIALASPQARALFEQYELAVGSTGNLGLSIGMIAKGLGFSATVHMSADAKQWKKERLRDRGVNVVEHTGDYAAAVAAGRALADADPKCYFVDDEHSTALFLGYAVAAEELKRQLAEHGRAVDADHPLFVYLPCGVGGAPGGIAYGLKLAFGNDVHCFFAEPTASPCMLLQLAQEGANPVSVYDIGLSNQTEADGLAVATASPLVAPLMRDRLSGVFTVSDDTLLKDTYRLAKTDGVFIEPSAAAGLRGPEWMLSTDIGAEYLRLSGVENKMHQATHVVWATGGSLVPQEELMKFQARGAALSGESPVSA